METAGVSRGGRDGLRQWEDDRLDAIIATDEYIEDMESKIRDLEEIVAEVIKELKDDEDSMDL
jgi:phage shock protein A